MIFQGDSHNGCHPFIYLLRIALKMGAEVSSGSERLFWFGSEDTLLLKRF
jgi:hypothetical protein